MYNDLPQRKVQDIFTNLLYGDQPAGRDIAGTKENVSSFKRQDFVSYREKFYTAPETVVIVSGNFDEEKMLSALKEGFKDCPKRAGDGKLPVVEKQDAPQVFLEHKSTDQSHFVLGVRTFDIYDKRNASLKVLAGILGGGMSSRLFEKMRNQLGICYYVNASSDAYTDHGVFSISAGVRNDRLEEAIREILIELKKLKNESVDEKELEKVKEHLIGNMYLGLESSDSLADFYGFQEIMKKPIRKPDEIAKEIKIVSSADIKKLANEIFIDNILNLAVIGPEKDKAKLLNILSVK
jgi:predicted Zn-dependent peptidase